MKVAECKKNIPCYKCTNTSCFLYGFKGSDCPKQYCDRPEPFRFECNRCGFIDKYIEDIYRDKKEV